MRILQPTGWTSVAAGALAMVALTGAGPGDRRPAVDLAVSGRSNAEPSVAARGAFVVVTWAAATADGTDVYAAVSRDGGGRFGLPVRVNDLPGQARVSGEQAPEVALVPAEGRDPSIVVVWTARGETGTRLLFATSDSGARAFSRAAPVPGSEAPGNRGWEAAAVDARGRVAAIWLDHRELAAPSTATTPMAHDGQAHTGHGDVDAVVRAQRSKLYFTRIGEAGAEAIAGGVCYCCKTALASGADGSIYAAWRHVYPGNIRDIAFAASRDGAGFAAPVRVSEDHWVLDGCPENGPAIAVDRANRVHIVWPTLVTGAAQGSEPGLALFYAATADGRRFGARQPIPTEGTPRHPQVAAGRDGGLLIVWDEQSAGGRHVVMADGRQAGGAIRFVRRPDVDPERGEYPVVASVDDGFVVAWTHEPGATSTIRVRRIAAAP
jgi:hypothetical protein